MLEFLNGTIGLCTLVFTVSYLLRCCLPNSGATRQRQMNTESVPVKIMANFWRTLLRRAAAVLLAANLLAPADLVSKLF